MQSPPTGSLLRISREHKLTYWSVTQRTWFTDTSVISLADICGLRPTERDRLLDFWRGERLRDGTVAKRLLNAAKHRKKEGT